MSMGIMDDQSSARLRVMLSRGVAALCAVANRSPFASAAMRQCSESFPEGERKRPLRVASSVS